MKNLLKVSFILLSVVLVGQTLVTDTGLNALQQIDNQQSKTNIKINKQIDRAIKAVEQMQKQTQEALKNASWAKTLKSTTDFINVTESTICTLHDFYKLQELNIQMPSLSTSCLDEIGIDTSLLKMQNAYENFNLALTNGIPMTVQERLQTLKGAHDDFNRATSEIDAKSKEIKKVISNRAIHNQNIKSLANIYSNFK